MALDEIRDQARASIHEAFTVPATVRSPDGLTEVTDIGARLHRDLRKPFGDLDREGFALVMEFTNQVIFDRQQWEPVKNWTVDFGRGRVFNIDNIISESSERYVRTEVSEKR
jgi:ribulose bisphosphate carboxylase small subunit